MFGEKKVKARTLDEIRFQDHTREEVIAWLKQKAVKKPSYGRLIRWITESAVLFSSHHEIQVAIAKAQRQVDEQ